MVIAGAFADPVDGAMFVFKGATVAEIETYAKVSSFVREGVRSVPMVERSLADTTPFPFDPSSMDGCARVQTDPYVTAGLVTSWKIKAYTPVPLDG